MPSELHYIRAKEIHENANILMVISFIQLCKKNRDGQVIEVRMGISSSEEYSLDNIPEEIQNLSEIDVLLTRREFDHIQGLYENNIKEFIRYTP